MKVVINRCFGGFSLSKKAYEFLGLEWDGYGYAYNSIDLRTDRELVECVETLGKEASGTFAQLKVIDIPDGVNYQIKENDGRERIEEIHRCWY